jgi:hypothetical protein
MPSCAGQKSNASCVQGDSNMTPQAGYNEHEQMNETNETDVNPGNSSNVPPKGDDKTKKRETERQGLVASQMQRTNNWREAVVELACVTGLCDVGAGICQVPAPVEVFVARPCSGRTLAGGCGVTRGRKNLKKCWSKVSHLSQLLCRCCTTLWPCMSLTAPSKHRPWYTMSQ